MEKMVTEAWVLREGDGTDAPGKLELRDYSFEAPSETEVLAEPIFGCWEGNMTHAILRDPVDICRQRREPAIVLGNSGVVRILRVGSAVSHVRPGDYCVFVPSAETDKYGYTKLVAAYDAPRTMGLLAKQMKCDRALVTPIPRGSRFSLQQWAAFSLRYPTAWANWRLALGCWRLQVSETQCPFPAVWAWGGGVSYAQATLARLSGARAAVVASSEARLTMLRAAGLTAIDRRAFPDLEFDAARYEADRTYRESYLTSEGRFLSTVHELTDGEGVAIFIDNIGAPVFRATLRALAREGVIATCGWKGGMELAVARAAECVQHHVHVFTHGATFAEAHASIEFANRVGWMPPASRETYSWQDVGKLADAYAAGSVDSYFPLYRVNEL